MNREVFSNYRIMTVGENSGAAPEDAWDYAGYDRGELNMIFHFELMEADNDPRYGKWNENTLSLGLIKKIMTRWQEELYQRAWNSLYWNNHDQPRAVSRFGDDSEPRLWEKSAKLLGTCLHMMRGAPYIYQGEELGMTNMPFGELGELRDLQSLNAYRELVEEKKVFTHEKMMAIIRRKGRDNARTPMQWDAGNNAGFTTGTPWIGVNPNYTRINAAAQMKDPASIWNYYRRLIALRKSRPVIVYGDHELLLPGDERLYAYRRRHEGETLLVLCNFSRETADLYPPALVPAGVSGLDGGTLLIANYSAEERRPGSLLPWEARVYLFETGK
jgi:oligo-1,6-glucosidase